MSVTIRYTSKKETDIKVQYEDDYTFGWLREFAHNSYEIEKENVVFLYKGEIMDVDEDIMFDFGIKEDDVIVVFDKTKNYAAKVEYHETNLTCYPKVEYTFGTLKSRLLETIKKTTGSYSDVIDGGLYLIWEKTILSDEKTIKDMNIKPEKLIVEYKMIEKSKIHQIRNLPDLNSSTISTRSEKEQERKKLQKKESIRSLFGLIPYIKDLWNRRPSKEELRHNTLLLFGIQIIPLLIFFICSMSQVLSNFAYLVVFLFFILCANISILYNIIQTIHVFNSTYLNLIFAIPLCPTATYFLLKYCVSRKLLFSCLVAIPFEQIVYSVCKYQRPIYKRPVPTSRPSINTSYISTPQNRSSSPSEPALNTSTASLFNTSIHSTTSSIPSMANNTPLLYDYTISSLSYTPDDITPFVKEAKSVSLGIAIPTFRTILPGRIEGASLLFPDLSFTAPPNSHVNFTVYMNEYIFAQGNGEDIGDYQGDEYAFTIDSQQQFNGKINFKVVCYSFN
ncbi:hypothetical protein WA158_008361 [Blastocystis sp. Blastoise]